MIRNESERKVKKSLTSPFLCGTRPCPERGAPRESNGSSAVQMFFQCLQSALHN